jgi:hypothetical protein
MSFAFGGAQVVLDPRGRVHVLNSGAAAIWTLIDAGYSREETAATIAAHGAFSTEEALIHVDAMSGLWQDDEVSVDEVVNPPRELSVGAAPQTYRIGATRFAFSSEDAETRLRVESVLADCADAAASPDLLLHVAGGADGDWVLLKNGQEILASACSGEMAGAIFQAILEAANPGIEWLALMHGAAIGIGGAAILLPGTSGAGKSTLAAYLSARGADYLTDDLIALASDGTLVPWPTRISAKRGSWPTLLPHYPVLDTLPEVDLLKRRIKFIPVGKAPWARPPQPVRALYFPEWSELEEPRVQALTPLEALVKLVEERLWLGYPISESRLRGFLEWLAKIPAYHLRYSSLEQAEQLLQEANIDA